MPKVQFAKIASMSTVTPLPSTLPPLRFRPVLVVWTDDAAAKHNLQAARSTLVIGEGKPLHDGVDLRVVYRTASSTNGALADIACPNATDRPESISMYVGNTKWGNEECQFFIDSRVRAKLVAMIPCVATVEATDRKGPWALNPLTEDSSHVDQIAKCMRDCVEKLYRALPVLDDEKLITKAALLDEKERKATEQLLKGLGAPAQLDIASPELQALQRLVFPISPGAARMRIVKLYNEGKSGATVAAVNIEGEADVIIKVGSTLAMQSELYGYSTVMDRKLRTGVGANALYGQGRNGMTITQVQPDGPERWLALLAYSYAGPPGQQEPPKSLREWIDTAIKRPDLRAAVLSKVQQTLDSTVSALHRGARVHGRTLWQSFGQVLPPLLAIRVASAPSGSATTRVEFVGGVDKTFLASDAEAFRTAARLPNSPSCESTRRWIELTRMNVHDLSHEQQGDNRSSMQLRHPRLGVRVIADCPLRLDPTEEKVRTLSELDNWVGQPWLRRGCMFDVEGEAIAVAQALPKPEWQALNLSERAAENYGSPQAHDDGTLYPAARNLFLPDGPDQLTSEALHYIAVTFPTAVGATHGDLNINNVLFSGSDITGWLIDFEHARNDGAIAFDYAKLIVETINHVLLAQLSTICRAVAMHHNESLFEINARFALDHIADSLALPLAEGALSPLLDIKRSLATYKGADPGKLLPFQFNAQDAGPLAGVAFILEVISRVTQAALRTLKKAHRGNEADAANDLYRAVAAYAFASKKFFKRPSDIAHCRALEGFSTRCLHRGIPGLPRQKVAATTGSDAAAFLHYWLNPESEPANATLPAAPPKAPGEDAGSASAATAQSAG